MASSADVARAITPGALVWSGYENISASAKSEVHATVVLMWSPFMSPLFIIRWIILGRVSLCGMDILFIENDPIMADNQGTRISDVRSD